MKEQNLAAVTGPAEDGAVEDLPAYCANPLCRREFRRKAGPGRRKEFHSELCRREAEREYRRTLQRLRHLENQVEQQRLLAAAFARSASAPEESSTEFLSPEVVRTAEDAVVRVGGMLKFLKDSEEPLAVELREFYEAVAPVIRR